MLNVISKQVKNPIVTWPNAIFNCK